MLLEQRQGKVCVVRTATRKGLCCYNSDKEERFVLLEQRQGKVCVVRTVTRKGLCC